jgi:POT family proton-dependent oligopeptide transporter
MSGAAERPQDIFIPPPPGELLGHPRSLWMLFMTEFWERFCFYGMRWMLTLYIVAQFFSGDPAGQATASQTYGAYLGLVYATAIAGGYIADKILGYQRSVLLGALFISSGLFSLLVPDETVFKFALTLVIVGNGLFKPNISSMVGKLYAPGDARRDRGFTIFYMGINAGAFFAPLVTGWIAGQMGYLSLNPADLQADGLRYGFATAGAGMLVSYFWFLIGRRKLGPVGGAPAGREGWGSMVAVTAAGLLVTPLIFFLLGQNQWLSGILSSLFLLCCVMLVSAGIKDGSIQRDRIFALLILFVANIMFWMFFEQAGASFNFLAEGIVDRQMFGGWEFPVGWFQSVNPAAIVLLAPLVTLLWAWLDKRGMEPNIPRKFGIGLIGNAAAFALLMYALTHLVDDKSQIPFWTLAAVYVLQTVGELHLSPIGLSMVTKLAPVRLVGLTMGAWFLSISIGNSLAGAFSAWISAEGGEAGMTVVSARDGFTLSFWLLLATGALVFILAPFINRLMHGVR